ncbi:hypothetical protein Enr13x_70770 [Stieleria neptunia]|uniref:Uncharacterized protein n=1 Tax=Stieleria neptunia TaxID=2527979 RepID=A0A518I255_9BACT|nr:hypothetical protein [Stieleria neptunia]QDV47168.1 hypothetical protein Enr13x_70770 [Stieleria neptunia]
MITAQSVFRFTVDDLETSQLASTFKILKNLDSTLTISDVRRCLSEPTAVAQYQVANADFGAFVSNLGVVVETAESLSGNSIPTTIEDLTTAATLSLSQLRASYDHHVSFLNVTLNSAVTSFLSSLRDADWFQNLGKDLDGNIRVVLEAPPSGTFTYPCIGIQNAILGQLMDANECHFACLSPFFRIANDQVTSLLDYKLADPPGDLPDLPLDDVQAIISHACLELQFLPEQTKKHAVECCQWLLRGKLPVGWDGDFPQGELLVT